MSAVLPDSVRATRRVWRKSLILLLACTCVGAGAGVYCATTRPLFSGWRSGDLGWSWRSNRLADPRKRLIYYDVGRNMLLISNPCPSPGRENRSLERLKDSIVRVGSCDGRKWEFRPEPGVAYLFIEEPEIKTCALPDGFVARFAKSLRYPEQVLEEDVVLTINRAGVTADAQAVECLCKLLELPPDVPNDE